MMYYALWIKTSFINFDPVSNVGRKVRKRNAVVVDLRRLALSFATAIKSVKGWIGGSIDASVPRNNNNNNNEVIEAKKKEPQQQKRAQMIQCNSIKIMIYQISRL